MKTKQEYYESLRKLKLEVYMFGERVEDAVDHPIIRPSVECVAATYELAEKPENQDMMTAVSHLTGKRINRFCHVHQSVDDLVNKSKMGRGLGAYTGSCFQRCVGMDALNTLSMVTYRCPVAPYSPAYCLSRQLSLPPQSQRRHRSASRAASSIEKPDTSPSEGWIRGLLDTPFKNSPISPS